ncbi:cell envelope biogenesis protein TolA [Variovorax gossypii]
MKKILFALGATTLLLSGAYAQSQSQEAVPPTNTKPQAVAEARKNAKPAGVVRIKDGSTAVGQGSGVRVTSKSEMAGESRKAAREARPHRDSTQGGTPQESR